MPTVAQTLHASRRAERGRAAKTLLRYPLLTRSRAPEEFDLCVVHRLWLQRHFAENAGWNLHVDERRGFARLRKLTDANDDTRPALTSRADPRPFNRRRYVLLAVTCAALQQSKSQTTLRELSSKVAALTDADPVLDGFDPGVQSERRSLVDAVRHLVEIGILEQTDARGDYTVDADADLLLSVDHRRLAHLLAIPRGPQSLHDLASLIDPAGDDPEQSSPVTIRRRVMRQLLDNPALYYADLDAAERDYLAHNVPSLREALNAIGFDLERRAEGWALIDEDAVSSDVAFPGPDSIVKHAALLLCDTLVDQARRADQDIAVPFEVAADFISGLLTEHANWARTYQASTTGADRLTRDALELLRGLRLVSLDAQTIHVLPAAARFRPVPRD